MKTGTQTISWGSQIHNIDQALQLISACNYQGVEFSQRIGKDTLGAGSLEELHIYLEKYNLKLMSIVGGTLEERLEFCKVCSPDYWPDYLYVGYWELTTNDQALRLANDMGIDLALHPRVFTSISKLEDIQNLSDKYPKLKFILDTAHCYLAGDDLVTAFEALREKLVAVHLKDWQPNLGRSIYRFARGFVELGLGELSTKDENGGANLDRLLSTMSRGNYDGWIVSELDNPTKKDIPATVVQNASWLAQRQILPRLELNNIKNSSFVFEDKKEVITSEEFLFRSYLLDAATTSNLEQFFDEIAKAFRQVINCPLVTVCSYTSEDYISIRGYDSSEDVSLEENVAPNLLDTLTGIAVHRQAMVTKFDLSKESPGYKYGKQFGKYRFRSDNIRKKLNLKWMISLPVYNSGNPNAVRMIVNLFPQHELKHLSDEYLHRLSKAVTQASDSVLDTHCISVSTQTNLIAQQCRTRREFLKSLVLLIKTSLSCEGVAIFTVSAVANRLELDNEFTTGTYWYDHLPSHERYYLFGEGETGRCWSRNEVSFKTTVEEQRRMGKSTESFRRVNGDLNAPNSNLWIPLRNSTGEAIGVIRCLNKMTHDAKISPSMFSYNDLSIVDAIVQTAAPHIDYLNRTEGMSDFMHELRRPIITVQAICDEYLAENKDVTTPGYVSINEIRALVSHAARYTENIEYSSFWPLAIPKKSPQIVSFIDDILLPSLKVVQVFMRRKKFSPYSIDYSEMRLCPRLHVDREQFRHVFYNLLSNSINYADKNPRKFRIEITYKSCKSNIKIFYRDWGIGVDRSMQERVFLEGVRSPEAITLKPYGLGIGLHVCRSIISGHNANILISNYQSPLEFTIEIPKTLIVAA